MPFRCPWAKQWIERKPLPCLVFALPAMLVAGCVPLTNMEDPLRGPQEGGGLCAAKRSDWQGFKLVAGPAGFLSVAADRAPVLRTALLVADDVAYHAE